MSGTPVSIITPTTHDRELFNARITQIIQQQTYPNIVEHLFDYSDDIIGAKRNNLCKHAIGEIILHADSDDLYANDWVERSVNALKLSGRMITGLTSAYFYDGHYLRQYNPLPIAQPSLIGATLCYYKKAWQKQPFKNSRTGEEHIFIANGGGFAPHDYIEGFCAILHGNNTASNHNLFHKEFSFVDIVKAPEIISQFYY